MTRLECPKTQTRCFNPDNIGIRYCLYNNNVQPITTAHYLFLAYKSKTTDMSPVFAVAFFQH